MVFSIPLSPRWGGGKILGALGSSRTSAALERFVLRILAGYFLLFLSGKEGNLQQGISLLCNTLSF
jgi:hypothetical protein